MLETWVEEKDWERIRKILSGEYNWRVQYAKKRNRKGRAIGGIIMGIKKELMGEIEEKEEQEGRIEWVVGRGEEKWRIVGVYVNGDMKEKMESLKDWMEEREEGVRTIIGGDFNARTGEEGGWQEWEEWEEEEREKRKSRRSKDKKLNDEGRKLLQAIEEKEWVILNGSIRGDEEGEYTYTGERGETVIDYALGGREIVEEIEKLEIGEKVDSDHHPVIVWIKGRVRKERVIKERRKIKKRGRWDVEGREKIQRGNREGGKRGRRRRDRRGNGGKEKKNKRGDNKERGRGKEGKEKRKGMVGRRMHGRKETGQKRAEKMEKGRNRW